MPLQETFERRRLARRRSQLVPWGALLVALAVLVPRPLFAAADEMGGVARALAYVAADVFRAGFFVGIACWVVGARRNRRWKREAEAAERAAAPHA